MDHGETARRIRFSYEEIGWGGNVVGPQARRPHQIFVPLVWAQCASNLHVLRDRLFLSLSLSFTPWYPLCLAHLPSSSIASTEAPFPRASVPLSSLFFSRYPCLSFFYVGLSFSYSSSESSTQPLRGASRRSRVSARAFRLAVQRILG